MAWRDKGEPEASCAMDADFPETSLATSARRVSSPNAAKTTAWCGCEDRARLWLLGDMGFNILHLLRPAAFVHAESFSAAMRWNVLES